MKRSSVWREQILNSESSRRVNIREGSPLEPLRATSLRAEGEQRFDTGQSVKGEKSADRRNAGRHDAGMRLGCWPNIIRERSVKEQAEMKRAETGHD